MAKQQSVNGIHVLLVKEPLSDPNFGFRGRRHPQACIQHSPSPGDAARALS